MSHPWVAPGAVGPMDDAAIVCPPVDGRRALVMTVDVITPIVDDPRAFGRIAAANAMSDVWAMGGRPEIALSFVGFPTDKLPLSALAEVMGGLADACRAAGVAIVGGHTISDGEPKAGLSVTGSVDVGRVWSHGSARAGQALVLTKALGTGVIGQAIRKGTAPAAIVEAAVAQMTALNAHACAVGLALGATSCTDVTGFGLLGHLRNIVEASGVDAVIEAGAVPLLDGALDLARDGVVPGGSRRNLDHARTITDFADTVDEPTRLLLADAQTSGGLLLCLPKEHAREAVERLRASDDARRSAIVGELAATSSTPSMPNGCRIRVV